MHDDLTPELALANAPNERAANLLRSEFSKNGVKYSEAKVASLKNDAAKANLGARLSPSERAQLEAFKQGARAAESVRQQNEKHGGPVAIARKERASAGVLAQNIHSKGK
ncbi:MAG: hypothetical protein KA535_03385 [Azonexus sp.]|nr:hypothetical protein [Azonexus sp.]